MAVASFVDTTTPKIREENLHSTQSHFDKSQCIVSYMNSLVKPYIKLLIKVHPWPKSLFSLKKKQSQKKTKKEDPSRAKTMQLIPFTILQDWVCQMGHELGMNRIRLAQLLLLRARTPRSIIRNFHLALGLLLATTSSSHSDPFDTRFLSPSFVAVESIEDRVRELKVNPFLQRQLVVPLQF